MTTKKMKSEVDELKQEIDELKEEIVNLEERQKNYSKELEGLTDGLVSNFDDLESRAEIRELKSDKDVLQEVIQRKQNKLNELEETLSAQQAKFNREKQYEELISQAKKASSLEDKYNSRLKELDNLIKEKIVSIASIKSNWKETAESFMRLADNIEKGFLQTSNLALMRNNESSNRDDLVKKLEDEEGLNLDSAMSNKVLRSQSYSLTRNGKNPEGLTFSSFINDLLRSKKVAELDKESQ